MVVVMVVGAHIGALEAPYLIQALTSRAFTVDVWLEVGASSWVGSQALLSAGARHVRELLSAHVAFAQPQAASADAVLVLLDGSSDGDLAARISGRFLGRSASRLEGLPVLWVPILDAPIPEISSLSASLQHLLKEGARVLMPLPTDLERLPGDRYIAGREAIVDAVQGLGATRDLEDVPILVSAGPTLEALDPVRFISNHSSGRMGYDIARVAARRGAHVTLISGPVKLRPPREVTVVRVESAAQMCQAVLEAWRPEGAVLMAAAVADYTPLRRASQKIKKSAGTLQLELQPTVDILAQLGRKRQQGVAGPRLPVLVGFAMETEDLVSHARAKLERKGCDLIVANDLGEPGAGFGHETNRVTLLHRDGRLEALPLMSKEAVAEHLLTRVRILLDAAFGERVDHA